MEPSEFKGVGSFSANEAVKPKRHVFGASGLEEESEELSRDLSVYDKSLNNLYNL